MVLRKAIKAYRPSVYALCKIAGVEPASVSRFVRGSRSLRLDKADRIAAVLGLRLVSKKRKESPRGKR